MRRFIMRGVALGLVPTATTNGVHAVNSYHKMGRAADMGLVGKEIGTAKGARRLRRFQRAEFRSRRRYRPAELIGPINDEVVLKHRHHPLREGDPLENMHDNHVHGAW